MSENTKVYIKLLNGGRIPVCQSEFSAGYDLFAPVDMVIRPGETKIMPMNFVIALEPDVEAQVRPRSGLSLRTTLRISNSPGTIDSDYRDLVGVIIENVFDLSNLAYLAYENEDFHKKLIREYRHIDSLGQRIYIDNDGNPYGTIHINAGDRIAQLVFSRYLKAEFIETDKPEYIGNNRGGGFGHSGK
ncbi:MAG: aminotransferase [Bacillota bacterium]